MRAHWHTLSRDVKKYSVNCFGFIGQGFQKYLNNYLEVDHERVFIL